MDTKIVKQNSPGFSHGLLVILISAIASLLVGAIGLIIQKVVPSFSTWNILFSFVSTFILTFVAAQFIWQDKEIETNKVPILFFVLLVPATIAMSIISESVVSLIPLPQVVADFFEKMIQMDLPGYLTVAIAAPILEELIFRGVILKGFLKKFNPQKAIIYSSLLFGIAHLNPWQFLAAFIAGMAIGWIYYKTRSIWPAIFIHFVNNTFSFIIGYKYNDINTSFYDISGGFLNYLILILVSLSICFLAYKKIKGMTFYSNDLKTSNEI